MQLSITGYNLPGREFRRADGSPMANVHVGVQVGREPAQLVRADSPEVRWDLDVDAVVREGQHDFRGPAVHGKRGERFVYLTLGRGAPRRQVRDVPASQADAESDRRGCGGTGRRCRSPPRESRPDRRRRRPAVRQGGPSRHRVVSPGAVTAATLDVKTETATAERWPSSCARPPSATTRRGSRGSRAMRQVLLRGRRLRCRRERRRQ